MVRWVGEGAQHRGDGGHLAVAVAVRSEQLGALGHGYILDLDVLDAAALGEAGAVRSL
jgi:hypothetical protein